MNGLDYELPTIVKQNASNKVADELRKLIIKKKIAPGTKLPSERILSEQFGVGRYTVREGLAILQTSGIIKVLSGRGAFVCENVDDTVRDILTNMFIQEEESLHGILETRSYIEAISAELAAKHIMAPEITKLEGQLEILRQASWQDMQLNKADEEFHYIIAQATHNESLEIIIRKTIQASKLQVEKNIFEYSKIFNLLDVGIETVYTEEFRSTNFGYHQRIFDAIRRHDPVEAHQAMFEHLSEGILVKHLEKKIKEMQKIILDAKEQTPST